MEYFQRLFWSYAIRHQRINFVDSLLWSWNLRYLYVLRVCLDERKSTFTTPFIQLILALKFRHREENFHLFEKIFYEHSLLWNIRWVIHVFYSRQVYCVTSSIISRYEMTREGPKECSDIALPINLENSVVFTLTEPDESGDEYLFLLRFRECALYSLSREDFIFVKETVT